MKKHSEKDNITKASKLLSVINGKTALLILAVLIGICIFLGAAVCVLGFKAKNYVNVDDEITVDIYHANSKETTHYDSNFFKAPKINDCIVVTVPIPEENNIPNAYLCFNIYNSIVRVVYNTDDSTLPASISMEKLDSSSSADGYKNSQYFQYDMEMEDEGRFTGHQVIKSPIPEKAVGHTAQIFLLQQDNYTTSRLDDICIIEGQHAFLYPFIISSPFEFPVFITFFIIGIVIFISFVVLQICGLDMRPGIWLSLFCLSISIWVLGYNAQINLLSDNYYINCLSEYVTLYIVPITIYGYLKHEHLGPHVVMYFKFTQWAFLVFFIIATIVEFSVKGKGYASILSLLQIMLIVSSVLTLYFLMFGVGPRKDISRHVLMVGFVISAVFLVIEVLRLYLNKVMLNMPDFFKALLKHSYAPYVLLALESAFVISYLLRILKTQQIQNKRQNLEQLAFYDSLTGIPNRNSCEQHLKKIEMDNQQYYTMIFFDTNNLKLANDKYGHETGDKLLKIVARAINEGFGDLDGFFGRYGGDEFMACIDDSDDADIGLKTFYNVLKQANKRNYLPFEVVVAVGRYDHIEGDNITPEETLKKADDLMYENKLKLKGMKNVR